MKMSLINPETEARVNHQSTLKKLIDINEQYLIERSKLRLKQLKYQMFPNRVNTVTRCHRRLVILNTTDDSVVQTVNTTQLIVFLSVIERVV
jgi:hypothetical protein